MNQWHRIFLQWTRYQHRNCREYLFNFASRLMVKGVLCIWQSIRQDDCVLRVYCGHNYLFNIFAPSILVSYLAFLIVTRRWKGSVYRLIWFELLVFIGIYSILSLTYRFLLTGMMKMWVLLGSDHLPSLLVFFCSISTRLYCHSFDIYCNCCIIAVHYQISVLWSGEHYEGKEVFLHHNDWGWRYLYRSCIRFYPHTPTKQIHLLTVQSNSNGERRMCTFETNYAAGWIVWSIFEFRQSIVIIFFYQYYIYKYMKCVDQAKCFCDMHE